MDKSAAHKALLNYTQADECGVMVTVSRQAIEEVSEELEALKGNSSGSEMETIDVFAVIGNTENNEGRGKTYVKKYCEVMATALRFGRKGYVQGTDCPIHTITLFKPDKQGEWYGPVEIELPTIIDNKYQRQIDTKSAALEKAKSLGLSAEEIKLIATT